MRRLVGKPMLKKAGANLSVMVGGSQDWDFSCTDLGQNNDAKKLRKRCEMMRNDATCIIGLFPLSFHPDPTRGGIGLNCSGTCENCEMMRIVDFHSEFSLGALTKVIYHVRTANDANCKLGSFTFKHCEISTSLFWLKIWSGCLGARVSTCNASCKCSHKAHQAKDGTKWEQFKSLKVHSEEA